MPTPNEVTIRVSATDAASAIFEKISQSARRMRDDVVMYDRTTKTFGSAAKWSAATDTGPGARRMSDSVVMYDPLRRKMVSSGEPAAPAAVSAAAAPAAARGRARDVLPAATPSALGRDSELFGALSLAKGAGPLIALEMIGRGMESAAEKAKTLTFAWTAGKMSAGELGFEIAKMIPIFGHAVAAGQMLGDAILEGTTHFNANREAIRQEVKELGEYRKAQAELKNFLDGIQKDNDREAEQRGRKGIDRTLGGIADKAKEQSQAVRDKFKPTSIYYQPDSVDGAAAMAAQESIFNNAIDAKKEALKTASQSEQDAEKDNQSKITSILSEAQEERKRLAGDADGAELDRIRRSRDERIRELLDGAEREARQLTDAEAKGVRDRAKAEADAVLKSSDLVLAATKEAQDKRKADEAAEAKKREEEDLRRKLAEDLKAGSRLFSLVGNENQRFTTGVQEQAQAGMQFQAATAQATVATARNTEKQLGLSEQTLEAIRMLAAALRPQVEAAARAII